MNYIKISKIITCLSIIMMVSTACSEEFIKEESRSQLSTSTFFNTDDEAKLAINGLYRLLHVNALYKDAYLDWFYQFGGDEVGVNRAENVEQSDYTWNQSSVWIFESYKAFYEVIRNANLFISSIDGNEKISEGVRNQAVGEALFIRALMYWNLTNLWGDVPYFRELLSVEKLSTIERADKSTIRSEMRDDLDRAFSLLPGSYPASDLGRATKWAAATLKAKYYMMEENWQGMRDESIKVINNTDGLRLLDNFADVFDQRDGFNQFNDEIIFAVDFFGRDAVENDFKHIRNNWFNPRVSKDEPKNKNEPGVLEAFQNALAARNENMRGYAKMIPLPEIARQENWEVGDLRYSESIIQEYLGFELKFPYFKKMWNLDQEFSARNNSANNFVLFRMADVYLMAAEAENELNGPANAYQYVNAVRERAFEPDKPWSGLSRESFRLKIRDERKYELCAEGFRKLDLIRWGVLVETVKNMEVRPHNNPSANIQEKHSIYPIPEEEILLNPNILNTDPTNNGWQ